MKCPYCNTFIEPNQKFCGKCGSFIDASDTPIEEQKTVFAVDDGYEYNYNNDYSYRYNRKPDYPQPEIALNAEEKQSKTLGVIAIVLAVVLIVAVIAGSLIVGGKHLFDKQDTATPQEAYHAFVKNDILAADSMFRSDTANTKPDGVMAVKTVALDKNEGDELVVAYTEAKGSTITTNIACYEYDESNGTVELSGVVTPASETNYIGNDEEHVANEKVLYTFTYNDTAYLVFEYITYDTQKCAYDCHVYTMTGGVPTEDSSIHVESGNSEDYLNACNLVKTFFAKYGIVRNNHVVSGDQSVGRYNMINCASNTEFLYKYCYYRQSSGSNSYKDIYGYDDYSDKDLTV